MTIRPAVFITTVLIASFSLTAIVSRFVMRGVVQTAVTPTSATDQVVQAVKSKQVVGSTPDLGNPTENTKDYQAQNLTFFGNRSWLVADIPPRNPSDQQTTVIMQRVGKRYVISLGPGTDFPRNVLVSRGVPADLITFLDGKGMVSTLGAP